MAEFEASLGYILRLFQANQRPLKPECAEFEEGVSMSEASQVTQVIVKQCSTG